ncbi:MAG: ABC transporter permease [Candidatus Promineifilaceae bacterium]|nr:ABC transporter permease [Candidatus Promineifilaceae bacterium]
MQTDETLSTVAEIPTDNIADMGDYKANSLWRLTLRRLLRQRSAQVGLIILGIVVFMAVFAPVIATHDPTEVLIGKEDVKKRESPCIHLLGCPEEQPQHILGTDGNVRDLYSRIVYGSRVSLQVGFVVVFFAATIGTILGAVAGYAGSSWDNIIMRMLDVVLSFPSLLLAIAIVFVMEDRSLTNAMIAVGIVSIPAYARVVRSSVITLRESDYVEASRALGASNLEILFRRILPNALPPLIVLATLGFATAILDTAALSFLGLGAQEPTPEWGTMLGRERNQLFSAPHLVFAAGVAISVTVLGFNLLGDGLRDALDPRLVHAGVKSE